MLRTLYIRDYAIIDELEVEFDSGLNILTGETGAGKSIIVGALKMILGERASTDTIRSGAKKAVVEGHFDGSDTAPLVQLLEENDIDMHSRLIMRREIMTSHSRAFINDTPATLPLMRQVAACLIDLHGQHEHQSLLRTDTHLDLLDNYGGLGGMRADYTTQFENVCALIKEHDEFLAKQGQLDAIRERLLSEIEEIDVVAPREHEEDQLRDEERRLEHAERLFSETASLYDLLYAREAATADQLVVARNALQDIARIDPSLEELCEEIQSAHIAVAEVASMLQDYNARIEFNPDRLETIRRRLGALDRLKRRYGGTMAAVLAHREEIGREYEHAANYDASLKKLDSVLANSQEALSAAALRLSNKRHEVTEHIEAAIAGELAQLGMPNCKFSISCTRRTDSEGWIRLATAGRDAEQYAALRHGMEEVEFLVATNVGEPPKPLARIASGGEISRIMLGLKTILAKSDRLPILVFDEIDSGISGGIARKVGESMADLARYHQIIAITHLPQIAAAANAHFAVEKHIEKGRTSTQIRRLKDDEPLEHVAMLITGTEVTEAMRESARELMETG